MVTTGSSRGPRVPEATDFALKSPRRRTVAGVDSSIIRAPLGLVQTHFAAPPASTTDAHGGP